MELSHLLTRSGLTYPEVSSRSPMIPSVSWGVVFHYPGVIYFEAFYLHVVKVAIHPLDLPCSGPLTHSGEILTTDKSHGKTPDRFSFSISIII